MFTEIYDLAFGYTPVMSEGNISDMLPEFRDGRETPSRHRPENP
jgi:hypothetical protein